MLGVFFEGVSRVIYRILYVGLSDIGQNIEEAIFLTSTSKSRVIITSFRYEDSVCDPQTLVPLEAEDLGFLHVLLVLGVTLTSLLVKNCKSWAFVLRYSF